jgi:transcription initiation factor TFIIB
VIKPSSPKDYISRFSSILHLSPKTQNEALKILKKADISELTSGRGPAGIAAAALYVAALINDEKKTQREVADVAGITEPTPTAHVSTSHRTGKRKETDCP